MLFVCVCLCCTEMGRIPAVIPVCLWKHFSELISMLLMQGQIRNLRRNKATKQTMLGSNVFIEASK